MEVIGITKKGVIIDATLSEVQIILQAATGVKVKDVEVGQRIPAIDYAGTITKIKALDKEYSFREVVSYGKQFAETLENLNIKVKAACKLDGIL